MVKRIISILLLISLFNISSLGVFATSNITVENGFSNYSDIINNLISTKNLSDEDKDKILNDIGNLEQMGNNVSNISDISISDNRISYVLDIKGFKSVATVDELDNGDLSVSYVEGDKRDLLIKTTDGRLILNGNEIKKSYDEQLPINYNQITPYGFTYSTTTSCPYGTMSNYTYYAGMKSDPDITVEKAIAQMTIAALEAVVVTLLTEVNVTIANVVYSALEAAIISLRDYAINYNPNTQILSYKLITHYHSSTQSYTINNTLKVKMNTLELYVGRNYASGESSMRYYTYGVWG